MWTKSVGYRVCSNEFFSWYQTVIEATTEMSNLVTHISDIPRVLFLFLSGSSYGMQNFFWFLIRLIFILQINRSPFFLACSLDKRYLLSLEKSSVISMISPFITSESALTELPPLLSSLSSWLAATSLCLFLEVTYLLQKRMYVTVHWMLCLDGKLNNLRSPAQEVLRYKQRTF